jgi:hypothetical protein
MYLNNDIQSMKLIACLTLPSSVVNSHSGPTISRLLEMRKDGDNRPNYALKGKTQALVLESIFHAALDSSKKISRARRKTEWFKTEQADFKNVKLALINVGIGVFYDFTKFSPTALPEAFIGKGISLKSRLPLKTTSHNFKTSPRLKELQNNFQANNEVSEENGNVKVLDAGWGIFRKSLLDKYDLDCESYPTISSLSDAFMIESGCYSGCRRDKLCATRLYKGRDGWGTRNGRQQHSDSYRSEGFGF